MSDPAHGALPVLPYESPIGSLGSRLKRAFGSILGPVIGLVLVLAIFGIWKPDAFLSQQAVNNVLRSNFHFAIAAVGLTFVIITAGIDLSVGSTMALSCVVCAMVMKGFSVPQAVLGEPGGWVQPSAIGGIVALIAGLCAAGKMLRDGAPRFRALWMSLSIGVVAGVVAMCAYLLFSGRTITPKPALVAILAGVLAGAIVGLLNGVLITTLDLPPFIVTLATLEGVRGVTLYITDAVPISRLPDGLRPLYRAEWWGSLPPAVWITLILVLIAAPVLHFTVLGRYAYAIGSNERTARLCGVPVERYKTICYIIAGATAGLAGVFMTAKFNSGPPDEFRGAELTVIAAVVIGGTSLFGGEGTVIGSVLGVLMLGFLYSGCIIADISPHIQRVFIGGTIVLAAAADRFRHLGR